MPLIDWKLLFSLDDAFWKNDTYAVKFLYYFFLYVHSVLNLKVEHQTNQFVYPPFNWCWHVLVDLIYLTYSKTYMIVYSSYTVEQTHLSSIHLQKKQNKKKKPAFLTQGFCLVQNAGVRSLLALRFTSNHGRQDIIPKIFSWFGDFPWKLGVHIFSEMQMKVCSFRKFKAKKIRSHLVFFIFFLVERGEQAFVVVMKHLIDFYGNKLSRLSGWVYFLFHKNEH